MVRNILQSERVLVFQGGGSLGAYEAGAYKGIYEMLKKITVIQFTTNLYLI
jgi:predicted acylesterase/phospholipase RssA